MRLDELYLLVVRSALLSREDISLRCTMCPVMGCLYKSAGSLVSEEEHPSHSQETLDSEGSHGRTNSRDMLWSMGGPAREPWSVKTVPCRRVFWFLLDICTFPCPGIHLAEAVRVCISILSECNDFPSSCAERQCSDMASSGHTCTWRSAQRCHHGRSREYTLRKCIPLLISRLLQASPPS